MAAVTNNPVQRANGRRSTQLLSMLMAVLLALSGLLALSAIAPPAQAATIPNAITSVSLTSNTAPVVKTGTVLKFEGTWAVPNYSSPGDTFTLALPKELGWKGNTSFPLKNGDGDPVAQARVNSVGGQYVVTFTLTEFVAMKPLNISGSFFFWTEWRVETDGNSEYPPGSFDLEFEYEGSFQVTPPEVIVPSPQTPGGPTQDPGSGTPQPSDALRKGFEDWNPAPGTIGTLPGDPGSGNADPTKTPLQNAQALGGDYLRSPDIPLSWEAPHYAHVYTWISPIMPEQGTLTMVETPGDGMIIDCYTTMLSDEQLASLYDESPAGALHNPVFGDSQEKYWSPLNISYVVSDNYRQGGWLTPLDSGGWGSDWTRGPVVGTTQTGPWGSLGTLQYSQGVYTEVNHTGKVTTTCDTNANTLTVEFRELPKDYAVEIQDIAFVLDPNYTGDHYQNFSSATMSDMQNTPDTPHEQVYKAEVVNYNAGGSGDGTTGTYTNTIQVRKVDGQSGDLIDGARFNLYNSDGVIIEEDVAAVGGMLTFSKLSEQAVSTTYYIKETVAPAGYALDPDMHKVVVPANGTMALDIDNDSSGSVTVHKTDADTGDPLGGAQFALHYDDPSVPGSVGQPVLQVVTDNGVASSVPVVLSPSGATATATFSGLVPGDYWLVETTTPAGYDTAAPTKVTVASDVKADPGDPDPNPVVVIENDPSVQYGTITVNKTDGTDPLLGAVFSVMQDNNGAPGSAVMDGGVALTLAPVGATATVTSPNLVAGHVVWLVETTTPDGYQAAAPRRVVVGEGSNLVTIENVASPVTGQFTLNKTDGINPLDGAQFTVHYPNSGGDGPGLAVMDGTNSLVLAPTGSQATVTSPQLDVGTYWLVESTTPDGYTPSAPVKVDVTAGANTPVTVVNTVIPTQGTITVNKTDGVRPLDGAVFTVRQDDNGVPGGVVEVNGSPLTLAPTGGAATITSPQLTAGTYWLDETTTPEGYDTADPVKVTVVAGGTQSVTVVNEPEDTPPVLGKIVLSKTDAVTDLPLDGATFSVHVDNNGAIGPQVTTVVNGDSEPVLLSPTGANAMVTSPGLPAGDYWLVEVGVPAGYQTAASIKVTVADSTDESVTVENTPVVYVPRVDIEKFDVLTSDIGVPSQSQRDGADFEGDADTAVLARVLQLANSSPATTEVGGVSAVTAMKFVVTNTGDEPLVNVRIWDERISGVGDVDITSCYLTADAGVKLEKAQKDRAASADNPWVYSGASAPLGVGATITCEGVLPGIPAGMSHADQGFVVADGALSGLTRDRLLADGDSGNDGDLSDEDAWHARVVDAPSTTPTPTPTPTPTSSTPVPTEPSVDVPTPTGDTPDQGILGVPTESPSATPTSGGTVSGGVISDSNSRLSNTGAGNIVAAVCAAAVLCLGGVVALSKSKQKRNNSSK